MSSPRHMHNPQRMRGMIALITTIAALILALVIALWLTGAGKSISHAILGSKESPSEALERVSTDDPAAFIEPVLSDLAPLGITTGDTQTSDAASDSGSKNGDDAGSSKSVGHVPEDHAAIASTLEKSAGAEGDINGDGQADYMQTYTLKIDDRPVTLAAIALANGKEEPTVLPSTFVGFDLKTDSWALTDAGFTAAGFTSASDSWNGNEQPKGVPFEATVSLDKNRAGNPTTTAATVSAHADADASDSGGDSSAPAALSMDLGKLAPANDSDSPELNLSGNVAFGEPAVLTIHVPQTHTLTLSGHTDGAAHARLFTTKGEEVTIADDGTAGSNGDFILVTSADDSTLASVDTHVKLSVKPKVDNEKSTNTIAGVPTHTQDGKPIIYFTFDDGPGEYTPRFLDILAKNNAKATFFQIGPGVTNNPKTMQAVRDGGHAIGNHTWNHPQLTKLSEDKIREEVLRTDEAIGAHTTCMRPPYGATNKKVRAVLDETGHRQVLWDVDTLDWTKPGVDKIEQEILDSAHPGAVVLMHDGGGTRDQSAGALEKVLPKLAAQGYVFDSIPACR